VSPEGAAGADILRRKEANTGPISHEKDFPSTAFGTGDRADRGMLRSFSPNEGTENAAELFQASSWISEEHEPELTDHGVEDAVGERQGLTLAGLDHLPVALV
jgi:hypothetical protein